MCYCIKDCFSELYVSYLVCTSTLGIVLLENNLHMSRFSNDILDDALLSSFPAFVPLLSVFGMFIRAYSVKVQLIYYYYYWDYYFQPLGESHSMGGGFLLHIQKQKPVKVGDSGTICTIILTQLFKVFIVIEVWSKYEPNTTDHWISDEFLNLTDHKVNIFLKIEPDVRQIIGLHNTAKSFRTPDNLTHMQIFYKLLQQSWKYTIVRFSFECFCMM